uniref:Uncharacterized protein n=1 Tax=Lepeophtheirus salmonis TaxID=72036 RepID=A0A0K2TA90_LEPSM
MNDDPRSQKSPIQTLTGMGIHTMNILSIKENEISRVIHKNDKNLVQRSRFQNIKFIVLNVC